MVVSRANLQLAIGHGLSRVLKFVGSVCKEGLFAVSSVFGSDVGARHAKHRRQARAVAAAPRNSKTRADAARAHRQIGGPNSSRLQTESLRARTTHLVKNRREALTTPQILARVRSQQAEISKQRQQAA